MNTLEVKALKGILGGMICFGVAEIIAETQILSLDFRLRKLEKNFNVTNELVLELSKTFSETLRYFAKELRNEDDDKEDAE